MSKNVKILLLVAAALGAAYFLWRWYSNRKGSSSSTGLGSDLNSPAPNLNAAPSVSPAVAIPVTVTISHSGSDLPPEEANPVSRMESANNVVGTPGSLGQASRAPLPASAADVYPVGSTTQDKVGSPYATTTTGKPSSNGVVSSAPGVTPTSGRAASNAVKNATGPTKKPGPSRAPHRKTSTNPTTRKRAG